MRNNILWFLILAAVSLGVPFHSAHNQTAYAQRRVAADEQLIAERHAIENELQSIAIVERKLMIPMRDGKRIATDVYRPKDTSKKYPTIFVRTPYNFNFWDVRNGAPRDLDQLNSKQ